MKTYLLDEAYYVDLAMRTVLHQLRDTDAAPPGTDNPHREAYRKAFRETMKSLEEEART